MPGPKITRNPTGNLTSEDETPPSLAKRGMMTVVVHGSEANAVRPSDALAVYWVGTVKPNNMTEADLYNGPS